MLLLILISVCFNPPTFTYIQNVSLHLLHQTIYSQIHVFVNSNTRLLGVPIFWAPHKAVGIQR